MFYHGFDNYMKIAFPEDEVGFVTLCSVFSFHSVESTAYTCNPSCARSLARL